MIEDYQKLNYSYNIQDMSDKNMAKIECPLKKCFKYVDACLALCRRQKKCKALQNYIYPLLWDYYTPGRRL